MYVESLVPSWNAKGSHTVWCEADLTLSYSLMPRTQYAPTSKRYPSTTHTSALSQKGERKLQKDWTLIRMVRFGTHGRDFYVPHLRPTLGIRRLHVPSWHEERLDRKMIIDVALRLCVRARCSNTSQVVRFGDIGLRVEKKGLRSLEEQWHGVRGTY